MSEAEPRRHRILDLLAAHKELGALELVEFRQAVVAALIWIAFGLLSSLVGWIALNGLAIYLLRDDLLRATLVVAGGNLLLALVAGLVAKRLLSKPFFSLTRRETARDLNVLVKAVL